MSVGFVSHHQRTSIYSGAFALPPKHSQIWRFDGPMRAVDGSKSAEVQTQQGVAKAMKQSAELLAKSQAAANPAIRGAVSGGLLFCAQLAPQPWRVAQDAIEFCPPVPAENIVRVAAGASRPEPWFSVRGRAGLRCRIPRLRVDGYSLRTVCAAQGWLAAMGAVWDAALHDAAKRYEMLT
jgi:hypothetical protein